MSRAEHTRRVTGCDPAAARVLMVGAGGIGCELIKNLTLCGFKDIEAIDLDTIDYSNLNRQFLFRANHVNRPKVEVARDTVLTFPHDEGTAIKAHHSNVKAATFGLDYFRQFDIVLNALDNIDARRHVNRLCLAAGVPLVESGTEGYLGQVTVIKKGVSECYECQPKSDNKKTYPICTVRNHPDKPVHCIAWAKELLFKKVFEGEETDLVDNSEADAAPASVDQAPAQRGGDVANGHGGAGSSASALHAQPAKLERLAGESARAFAARVFDAVFRADVVRLLAMDSLWKTRKPPKALRFDDLVPSLDKADTTSPAEDQAPWSIAESARAFVGAITRAFDDRGVQVGGLSFDKDDEECLDFVTAASNLRAAIFGIPLQSRFKVKEIAGNIIPAIATTNAIIAGYIAIEALKVLRSGGDVKDCASVYLCRAPSGKRKDKLLVTTRLGGPDPNCCVCGSASVTVDMDLGTATGALLVEEVLRKKLSFHEPNLRDGDRGLYECGDLDAEEAAHEAAKLTKLLTQPPWNLASGTMLDVDDHSQSLNCQIILRHNPAVDRDKHPLGFIVQGTAPVVEAEGADTSGKAGSSGAEGSAAAAAMEDVDDLEIIEPERTETPGAGKRPAGGKAPATHQSKRQRGAPWSEVVSLEEDIGR